MSFNSNNNNNSEDDEFITINVKTLDSTNIELCVKKNMPVLEFRKMVTNKTGIPLDRQKLIFQGKVLKDDHTLATYSIKDGQTVHLVTRPMGSSGPSASSSSSAPPPQAAHQRPPTTTAQGVVVSSLAVPDNGGMPDLNSLVSNVLNSLGINAAGGTGAIISATTEPGRQAPHAIDVQTFTINANGNRPPTVTTTSATATTITTTNVPSGASQTAQNLSNANVGDMLDQVHSIFTRSDILLTRLAELRRRPNLTPEEQNEAQNLSAQLAPVISNLSGLLGDLSPLLDPNNNNATAAPQYGNLPPIAGVQLHIHANANELDRLPQQLAQLQNTVPFVNPNALQLQNLLQQPSIQFHPVPQQRFIIQRSFPGQHGVQLQQQQAPVIYQLPQQQQPGQVGTRNATVTIVADSGQGGAQPSFLGNLLQMQRNLQQAQTQNRPSAPATTGQTQSAQANPLQGLLQAATGGAGAQPSPLNQLLQSMGPMISNLLGGVQQQQQAAGGAATTASRPASGAAATAGAAPAAGSMGNLLSSLLPMVSQVIGQNQGAAGSPVQATVDDNSPFDSILMAVMEPLNVTDMLAIVNGNYAVFDNSREPLERSLRRLLNNDSSAENRARLVETWATYVRNAMTNNEQIQREIRSRTAQGDVIAETVRACRKHFAALIDLTLDTSAATPFSQLLRGWITNFIGEWVDSLVACFRNGEADAQAFMQTIMVAIFSLLGNQYAMIGNLGANIFIDHAMRIYRAYKQQQQGTQPQQQPRVSPQPQQATAQPQPQPLVQPQPQQQPPAPSQATPTAAAAAAPAPAPAAVPAPTPAPTPAAAAPTIAPSSTTTTTTRPMETETVDDEEPWLRGLSPSERSELIQTLQRDERLQRQMPPPSHEYSTAYAASASIATAKATTFNARNSTNRTETSNNNNNNDNNDNDSNNDNTGGSQQK